MTEAAPTPPPKKKTRGVSIALVVLGAFFVLCVFAGIAAAIAVPAFIDYVKRSKIVGKRVRDETTSPLASTESR